MLHYAYSSWIKETIVKKKDDCFWDYGFVLKQYGVLWGFKEIFPSSISIQLLLFILWDTVMLWVFFVFNET